MYVQPAGPQYLCGTHEKLWKLTLGAPYETGARFSKVPVT